MIWLGVPVLDWLILAFALGLGVEAWLTTRPTPEERAAARRASDLRSSDQRATADETSVEPPANGRDDGDHAGN